MKYALILDTETTGLEPPEAKCIEVACMFYDIELASPISSYASLLHADSNAAEHKNGISPALLAHAAADEDVWPSVKAFAECADVIVAHKAEFDRKFVPPEIRDAAPWVCTKTDVTWPKDKLGEHLVHLALAYGVGVVNAHRAMADVDIMARIFSRIAEMGYSLDELFQRALRPKKRFVADVSFEQKDLAKAKGFSWDSSSRQWYRFMPEADVSMLPFNVHAG